MKAIIIKIIAPSQPIQPNQLIQPNSVQINPNQPNTIQPILTKFNNIYQSQPNSAQFNQIQPNSTRLNLI